jgi:WD40 repeat protein
MFIGTE